MSPDKFKASCEVLEHALADFIVFNAKVDGPADVIAILNESAKRMTRYVTKNIKKHGAMRGAAKDQAYMARLGA